jgi:hypothetical protein
MEMPTAQWIPDSDKLELHPRKASRFPRCGTKEEQQSLDRPPTYLRRVRILPQIDLLSLSHKSSSSTSVTTSVLQSSHHPQHRNYTLATMSDDYGSPLFMPSPYYPPDPAEQVAILVERAEQTQTLGVALQNFLDEPEHQAVFLDLFSRQVELVKSREQDWHRGQVTVFDKALIILTEHPNCLMSPTAIRFYCEEYLNLDLGGPSSELARTLRQGVEVLDGLKQGKTMRHHHSSLSSRPLFGLHLPDLPLPRSHPPLRRRHHDRP